MRQKYVKPFAEKVAFNYQEQIVASPTDPDSGNHICTGTRGENYTNCRDTVVWTD